MSTPELHPWLSTPQAYMAARKSVNIPLTIMPAMAYKIGLDELLSEALIILTECALPPRDITPTVCAQCGGTLEYARPGAKFCNPNCRKSHSRSVLRGRKEAVPDSVAGHIGSMWKWPQAEMEKYAIREVGYRLNNFIRTHEAIRHETAGSPLLENCDIAAPVYDPSESEFIADYLLERGVTSDGTETLAELAEAAQHTLGTTPATLVKMAA